tara:strand:+ start:213 stop:512 length:300 start_codon:yes stop_codon:yes gene_type:complete
MNSTEDIKLTVESLKEESDLFYIRVVKIPKTKTKEYNKTYYNKHQKERQAYGGTKIKCDRCHSTVRRDGIPLHKRSKKCMNFISDVDTINNQVSAIKIE